LLGRSKFFAAIPKRRVWAVAALVVTIGAVGLIWLAASGSVADSPLGPTAYVERGTLVVSVTEKGEIEAERRKVISNELRWPVVIKDLVSEGTLVKEGERIIQFECKELSDAIATQQISVTNAGNDYTQAREDLLLKKKEMANKVRKATEAIVDAKEALARYVEGDWPVQQNEAESTIAIARADLALAKDQLQFKLKVNKDPALNSPYSDNEIKADKLRVNRLELALEKAVSQRDMLLKYNHPRDLRKLNMAVEDAKLDMERASLEAKTQLLVAGAREQARKSTLEMRTSRLEDLLEDDRKLTVTAEKAGLVVYDTGGGRWRVSNVNVEVGEKINSRQQLMIIPDMSTLQLKTKVYEAMINQVHPGLKAYIRLDAKPDIALTGRVAKVGVLPDSQNRWLNPDVKVFNVIVKLDQRVEGLKPGMTADVELVLARLANVLSVPVATVFTEQEKTYCWRLDGGQPRRVPVKVGLMNDRRVQILAGLSQGQRVSLVPPTGTGLPGQAQAPRTTPPKMPTGKTRAQGPRGQRPKR